MISKCEEIKLTPMFERTLAYDKRNKNLHMNGISTLNGVIKMQNVGSTDAYVVIGIKIGQGRETNTGVHTTLRGVFKRICINSSC